MTAPAIARPQSSVDRWGGRVVAMTGGVILTIAAVLASQTMEGWSGLLLVALFLLGVGWNFCFVGGSTLLSDQLSPVERSRTQGTNDLLVGLASAMISLSSGLIFDATNYTVIAVIAGLLSLVPLFMAISYLRKSPVATITA